VGGAKTVDGVTPVDVVDVVEGGVVVVELDAVDDGLEVEVALRLAVEEVPPGEVTLLVFPCDEPDEALGVCADEQLANTADVITISEPITLARRRLLPTMMASHFPEMNWAIISPQQRMLSATPAATVSLVGGKVDDSRDDKGLPSTTFTVHRELF
jgi:hypothetical protein